MIKSNFNINRNTTIGELIDFIKNNSKCIFFDSENGRGESSTGEVEEIIIKYDKKDKKPIIEFYDGLDSWENCALILSLETINKISDDKE
jgi:hypothetical protein